MPNMQITTAVPMCDQYKKITQSENNSAQTEENISV